MGTVRRNLTWIGHTQPQGDPGAVYVNGSVHDSDVHSSLGGGGGKAISGEGGGVAFFIIEELRGDTVGAGIGIPNSLDMVAGDGACAGELHLDAEGEGECKGEIEGPWWV